LKLRLIETLKNALINPYRVKMPPKEREIRVILSGEIREKYDKIKVFLEAEMGLSSDAQIIRYLIATVFKNLKLE